MNLVYGEVTEISDECSTRVGKVRVKGAMKSACLELVPEAQVGDRVLLCDGVPIATVREDLSDVPRDSR